MWNATIFNIYEKYGPDHDIIYNSKKCLTILFKPKKLKDLISLPLYLCNNRLEYVNDCKYLGLKIETYSCRSDIKNNFVNYMSMQIC